MYQRLGILFLWFYLGTEKHILLSYTTHLQHIQQHKINTCLQLWIHLLYAVPSLREHTVYT